MARVLFFLLISVKLLIASDFYQERLLWQLSSGNAKGIENFCRQNVQQFLDRDTLDGSAIDSLIGNKNLFQACYMARFFSDINKANKLLTLNELKDENFSRWLLENPGIFEDLVFANRANEKTLDILHRIWLLENKTLSGHDLDIALGASLASFSDFSNNKRIKKSLKNKKLTPREEIDHFSPEACLEKYQFYKKSESEKKLFSQFSTLEPWEIGMLFRGRESVEDLAWGQEYLKNKSSITAKNAGFNACFIPYRDKNQKGVSVHAGAAFYDYKPLTLKVYMEYGGVCGAVSKAACGFLRAKGIPCSDIEQPGHCALVWKGEDGKWLIGNNIYGWEWSGGSIGMPWKGSVPMIISLWRFKFGEYANESNFCYYLSSFSKEAENREALLNHALKKNAKNYPAWQAWLALKSDKSSDEEKLVLLKKLKEAMPDDPYALEFTLNSVVDFSAKNKHKYELCALLLTRSESKDSVDLFMKRFWEIAQKDLPALKESKLTYDTKTKLETCEVLEKTIEGLSLNNNVSSQFLAFYGELLEFWGDKGLISNARDFAQAQLEKIDAATEQNKHRIKGLLYLSIRLSSLSGDEKATSDYSQKLQETKDAEKL